MTKENMLLDIMERAGIYSYAIDKTDHKLLFLDEKMKNAYKEAKVGDVCYKAFFNSDVPCKTCQICDNDFEQLVYDPCDGGIWFKGTGYSLMLEDNDNAAVMMNTRAKAPDQITIVSTKPLESE